jgi:hypothetical protein
MTVLAMTSRKLLLSLLCSDSSETRTMKKKRRQNTGTAEITFPRNVAGYASNDQTSTTVIRNGLNTFNLSDRIENSRFNLIHRVERMEPERIPNQLMDYTPRGTRSAGSLKLRWKEQPIL